MACSRCRLGVCGTLPHRREARREYNSTKHYRSASHFRTVRLWRKAVCLWGRASAHQGMGYAGWQRTIVYWSALARPWKCFVALCADRVAGGLPQVDPGGGWLVLSSDRSFVAGAGMGGGDHTTKAVPLREQPSPQLAADSVHNGVCLGYAPSHPRGRGGHYRRG